MAKSLFYKPLAILIIEESYLQRFFHTLKLEKHLDEDCVLPMNVFRQMIEKLQNQEQNS